MTLDPTNSEIKKEINQWIIDLNETFVGLKRNKEENIKKEHLELFNEFSSKKKSTRNQGKSITPLLTL